MTVTKNQRWSLPARMRRAIGIAIAAPAVMGCDTVTTAPEGATTEERPRQIELWPRQTTASALGEVVEFTATVLADGRSQQTDVQLVWTSSDTTVLVSEGNGRFRSRGNGTATVAVAIVGATNRSMRMATVVVQQRPFAIELSSDSVALYAIGHSRTVSPQVVDSLGNPITSGFPGQWRSLNPEIATVDSAGVITAQQDGEVQIAFEVAGLARAVTTRVASAIEISGCASSPDNAETRCANASAEARIAVPASIPASPEQAALVQDTRWQPLCIVGRCDRK